MAKKNFDQKHTIGSQLLLIRIYYLISNTMRLGMVFPVTTGRFHCRANVHAFFRFTLFKFIRTDG